MALGFRQRRKTVELGWNKDIRLGPSTQPVRVKPRKLRRKGIMARANPRNIAGPEFAGPEFPEWIADEPEEGMGGMEFRWPQVLDCPW